MNNDTAVGSSMEQIEGTAYANGSWWSAMRLYLRQAVNGLATSGHWIRSCPRWYVGFCVAVVAVVFCVKVASIFGAFLPQGVHQYQGIHSFADFLSRIGARNFLEHGFFRNYFLMNDGVGPLYSARGWQFYQVPQTSLNAAVFYTHYGSSDVRLVALLNLLGIRSLTSLYLTFLCISFGSLWFWYKGAARLFNPFIAITATAAIAIDFHFFTVAESPTAESLSFTLFFLFIYGLGGFLADEARSSRVGAALVVFVSTLLQAQNNPQFVPMMGLLAVALPVLFEGPRWRSLCLGSIAGAGFATGYAIHFALAVWALGGWHNFVVDMAAAMVRRTDGFSKAIQLGFRAFKLREAPGFLNHSFYVASRVSLLFLYFMIGAVIVGLWIVRRQEAWKTDLAPARRNLISLVLFAGAALVFPVVFVQAAVTQPLDILKIFVPVLGLAVGAVAWVLASLVAKLRAVYGGDLALGRWLVATTLIGATLFHYAVGKAGEIHGHGRQGLSGTTPAYTGADLADLRRIGRFVRTHTHYGDIIFAAANTGITGHPDYPHPAWEYYLDRRVEVYDRTGRWLEIMRTLEERRATAGGKLPMRFFVLADSRFLGRGLREFLDRFAIYVGSLEIDPGRVAAAVSTPIASLTKFELFRIKAPLPKMPTYETRLNRNSGAARRETQARWWVRASIQALAARGAVNKLDIRQMGPGYGRGGTIVASGHQLPSLFAKRDYRSVVLMPDAVRPSTLRVDNNLSARRGYVVDFEVRASRAVPLPALLADFRSIAFKDEAIMSVQDGEHDIEFYFFSEGVIVGSSRDDPIARISYRDIGRDASDTSPVHFRLVVGKNEAALSLDGNAFYFRLPRTRHTTHKFIMGDLTPPTRSQFAGRTLPRLEVSSLAWATLRTRVAQTIFPGKLPRLAQGVPWAAVIANPRAEEYSGAEVFAPGLVRDCSNYEAIHRSGTAYVLGLRYPTNKYLCLAVTKFGTRAMQSGDSFQTVALSGLVRQCLGRGLGEGYRLVLRSSRDLAYVEFDYDRITVVQRGTVLGSFPYPLGPVTNIRLELHGRRLTIHDATGQDDTVELRTSFFPQMVYLAPPWKEEVSCGPAYVGGFATQLGTPGAPEGKE